jgi:hypothetical protein
MSNRFIDHPLNTGPAEPTFGVAEERVTLGAAETEGGNEPGRETTDRGLTDSTLNSFHGMLW